VQANNDDEIPGAASASTPSTKQLLFVRYFTAVLIDLTVLNLFDEYWDDVQVGSFTISLLAALLLQVMLKITLALEHRVAEHFHAQKSKFARLKRVLSAWLILFASKFVILAAIYIVFGDKIVFHGPYHGAVTFIVVVVAMLATEELVVRFYKRLF